MEAIGVILVVMTARTTAI